MVPSEMLGKLSMLLFYIFFLATGTLADNATNLSADYVVTEPWCIYELNFVTWSYAVVIPYDGSKTDDGLDKAGKCGDKLRDELPLKGVAITDWHCHYGPDASACATFNTALLPHPPNEVQRIYKDVVGKKVDCNKVPEGSRAVCPNLF